MELIGVSAYVNYTSPTTMTGAACTCAMCMRASHIIMGCGCLDAIKTCIPLMTFVTQWGAIHGRAYTLVPLLQIKTGPQQTDIAYRKANQWVYHDSTWTYRCSVYFAYPSFVLDTLCFQQAKQRFYLPLRLSCKCAAVKTPNQMRIIR